MLAARGCDVSVETPGSGNGDEGKSQIVRSDLLALDAGDEAGADDGEIVIINGRYEDNTYLLKARVRNWNRFPDTILRLLNDGNGNGGTGQEQSVEELRQLVAGLPGVVFRCGFDPQGKVDFMNERIAEVCGYAQRRFMRRSSRRLLALVPQMERRQLLGAIDNSARTGKPFSLEHRVRCANGEERWLWHRGCIYQGRREHPELESFVVDITERKCEEQELAYLASHDALTGVANRAMFMEQVAMSMQRADRHGEMVACLFLDMDRFKRVNDSFGHAFGDELLQQVAARLKRCVRGNDLIGRLGGDEFVVLLDGIAEPQDAVAAAQKILTELDKPYIIENRSFSSSASIGISCYPGDAKDRASLLRNADAAMYSVKSGGRDGYRFFSTEMSAQGFATLAISNALREAIDTEAVELFYQPRIDLHTGRTAGLEVFARWDSEEFGDVPPSRFIALAEDVGLMESLGDLILRKACAQISEWDRRSIAPHRFSINLSPQQFRNGALVRQIQVALDHAGLAPERLELEIPEATLMQDPVIAAETLQALRALGTLLSVAGFGTGYSSLQLLQKFHVNTLKVDRSLMQGVPDDRDEAAIAEAIVAMAKRLDLRVVAEGIETEVQGAFARSAGCDEGQGYLYGRPVSGKDVTGCLERHIH